MTHTLTPWDDAPSWDQFVADSPYGHPLQSWEWGVVKSRTGWRASRYALLNGQEMVATAQILLRPLPYGLGTYAYVPKGPVLDYHDFPLLDRVIRGLREVTLGNRVIALKIEPEVLEPSPVSGRLLANGLVPSPVVQMRSTIWVDLSVDEHVMLSRQKQKTRYNIRLSARKGVTVRHGTLSDLDPWYEMYRDTARRDGFSIHDLDYYRTVLACLVPRNMAVLLLAEHEGDLLAGIIVFAFGRSAQYMYGASSSLKRNLMAPYLVQWEGMRWAKDRGATVYDLWGIPDTLVESEDLWGVYRHKSGYGGDIVRYIGAYDLVRSPIQHLAVERIGRPLFKRIARLDAQGAK